MTPEEQAAREIGEWYHAESDDVDDTRVEELQRKIAGGGAMTPAEQAARELLGRLNGLVAQRLAKLEHGPTYQGYESGHARRAGQIVESIMPEIAEAIEQARRERVN